jgi:CelD/BcsL family acetyltransferase involved in cellulose biosynthesis
MWLLAWWQVFRASERRELAAGLIYDGSRLVGIAPFLRRLCFHRHVIPYRRIEFLATGEQQQDEIRSDYLGVVTEPGYEEAAFDALADAWMAGLLGPFDEIVLSALDGDLPIWRHAASALAARGLLIDGQALSPAPYIRLPSSWDAYIGTLSGTDRYFVNRSIRDFDRWAGSDVTIERVKSRDDLEKGKQLLLQLHEERWQGAGQSGVFSSRPFKAFHDAVMPMLLERNALELVWLSVRGEPVAVLYNLIWQDKTMSYQGGRSMDVPKGVRPGIILHLRMIRAAIEAGRTEYDFLSGTSQYKAKLSNASRSVIRIRASRALVRDLGSRALEQGAAYVRARRAKLRGKTG